MKPFWTTLTLALLLSACTFYVSPQPDADVRVKPLPGTRSQPEVTVTAAPVISAFAPTQGAGSVYGLGETISFQVQLTESGYATLSVTAPDGSTSTLAQNVYLPAGTATLPTPEQRAEYVLAPPRGLQRATLSVSSTSSAAVQDTAETTFYIQ